MLETIRAGTRYIQSIKLISTATKKMERS